MASTQTIKTSSVVYRDMIQAANRLPAAQQRMLNHHTSIVSGAVPSDLTHYTVPSGRTLMLTGTISSMETGGYVLPIYDSKSDVASGSAILTLFCPATTGAPFVQVHDPPIEVKNGLTHDAAEIAASKGYEIQYIGYLL